MVEITHHVVEVCANSLHLPVNLRLINESVNVMSPNDVAFVSSGYAPMSVRLVQSIYSSSLQYLLRPVLEMTQRREPIALHMKGGEASADRQENDGPALLSASSLTSTVCGKKVMVCYYIGGVTHMEIAALRFLSDDPSFPFRIIVCTTKLTNGDALLRELMHRWG